MHEKGPSLTSSVVYGAKNTKKDEISSLSLELEISRQSIQSINHY